MKIDRNTQIGSHVDQNAARSQVKPANYSFGARNNQHLNHQNQNINKNAQENLGAKTDDAKKQTTPDIGEQKVQSSMANRARNLLNQKKKKKVSNLNSGSDDTTPSSMIDDAIDEVKAKIKRKITLKLMLLLAPILGFVLLIVICLFVVANFFPFLMPSIIINDDSNIFISGEDSFGAEEQVYYDKLLSKRDEYLNTCQRELDTNMIHASLIYLYYQQGYESIDYNSMQNMVDTIYNLLPSSCGEIGDVGGEFYNNLKNSEDFTNYYSVVLQEKDIDVLLEEIFDLGGMIKLDFAVSSDFIPENTTINIDERTGTSVGGVSVGGTGNTSSDNQITSVSFKDYLLGVVYANVDEKDYNNAEKIKSFVIVYTSNALARGSLSVDTQLIALNDPDNEMLYCNADKGCSFVVRDNKIYLQVGGGSSGNGNKIFYNGKYYYRKELEKSTKDYFSSIVDEVYGIVLLNNEGKYDFLDANKINSANITNYTEILEKTYKDYTIKNLRENNYVEGIDFYNQRIVIPTIAYDQSDYRSVRFCGRSGSLSSNNIESSGCGVTAIAIVVSSYENSRQYDPPYMSEEARKGNYCGNGIYGTLPGIFWNQAEKFGYHILNVGKYNTTDLNLVLSHLSSGHMVITNVGPGTFTRGGHYIVLTGTDPVRKKVYVTDPYDRGNKNSARKSGSGWYDFNLITKEAYSFYIIWKD